ncbi:sugar phosphate isomerase/epimerase family protein [Methylophaga thiooxydans]|uniref:AP endonuclease, family 2 n=1 Tax=Methylophaga thiooxydans DMS010 TaxID=637616 RepID=C0N4R1_9GAMM|nr:TIM barrel protein [Methylophaga thiooxydans]EEF80251.1 AP endonuclease, family 2 [Methylophaga thiooxydans DMS010]
MKLSLCTISFRHHLLSISDIAQWAQRHQFQGIELWGVHATNLEAQPQFNASWLAEQQLKVSMISDYLSVTGSAQAALDKVDKLGELAFRWGCKKIRTFAGHKPSQAITPDEHHAIAERLYLLAERCAQNGVNLVLETHPNTLADNTHATLQLLKAVDHPALAVNFDVLHLWEAGEQPHIAWQQLKPYIQHIHLKNISSAAMLNVFAPANVYAAAGNREGMVPLFEGALDYQAFLESIGQHAELDASLEWFGPNVHSVLQNDNRQLQRFFTSYQHAANSAHNEKLVVG